MRTSWSSASVAKQAALGPFLVLIAVLAAGCDELHSFTFVNSTSERVELTYTITIQGEPGVQDEEGYVMDAAESVNTESDPPLSGDKGQTIFAKRHLLNVQAKTDQGVIFERTFTYDDLKALDFRIEITEND